ncbi:uncharacterized protein LOC100643095 isoform X3 [Bombus terrestris]|uniref:Uncharacterized protein LOC100643095 isoform X3 n=1 Tax=Bombus terrestris TaxID=30195 RepID=A0A9B2JNX3_BOMTE|nr:uncharacterized protein LOC100643095 isoform X3 [Bombus terrestris]
MVVVMEFSGFFVLLLVVSIANSVSGHHHHHSVHADDKKKGDLMDHVKRYAASDNENVVLSEGDKSRSLRGEEAKGTVPFSERRLEKMLEKAILKIITGDLSTGDMLLLKSLNYSLEEVLAIRERELNKKKDEELRKKENMKSWSKVLYGDGEKKSRNWNKNSMGRSSSKKPDFENVKREGKKNRHVDRSPSYKDFDFEAYNRQAILDYENLPSNLEFQQSWSEPTVVDYEEATKASKEQDVANNLHRDFDRAMEPHVVFKIRYDDSEFDSSSGSDENNKNHLRMPKHHVSMMRHTTSKNTGNSFHASTSSPLSSATATTVPLVYQLSSTNIKGNYLNNDPIATTLSTSSGVSTTNSTISDKISEDKNGTDIIVHVTNSTNKIEVSKSVEKLSENKRISEYEGLEWVEDDVYRVIPEFVDSLGFENTEDNETSDYEDSAHDSRLNWNPEDNETDTLGYLNDTPDSVKLFMANNNVSAGSLPLANLSSYLQLAIAHRRGGNLTSSFDSQGEKAIEDIKTRVLALTGRFNLSTDANQVQRERLTMFSPTCQIPRNTDQDAWTDSFSMNMHFQLNLSSSDHVVAAKLRIFKLPQENTTSSSESTFDEEEEDEKKIRISVYYYTKTLKRHRSKKRLMDSVVTPLTSRGTHLALDVRQSLRFWRLNQRNSHGNGSNHGLVIQVEDQDGRPLKPALYIQQPSCADQDSDQKTSEYLHSSYEPVLVTFAS